MTNAPRMAANYAEELFASGFFCAESVLLALARAQGIESDVLPRIATAFCSGMARTCGTCGALTGAMMGIGLGSGRTAQTDSVQATYEATRQLINAFEAEFGSRDCHSLLGCDLGTQEGQATFRQDRLGRKCAEYTRRATEIAVEVLNQTAA
ncbi:MULTISPECIES: C-GCAxxG-C-C family protein [unclassified Uliginosibacterium]|uniref:C-GCAxxG-C-C family protein n=1 Tax=unclassified Uliginosibacterium TaxID=2621521 RepID=UPI000C7B6672|nr:MULTISPECIES: C-GCAxxG-C-C family protein [unclassified Uliginosibacterium]MDO6386099.1 C-GCAxxG-C-C family protein [Uliginosibacterium sp. 31-12]PLK49164.1 hypothetical protein C0V76_08165 [Uliginosibacterium sp. TH139]